MKLSAGSRWRSAVCEAEAVIVRAPKEGGQLECGGVAMIPVKDARPAGVQPDAARMTGSVLGKRYEDEAQGLEVLCTKPGQGALSLDGRLLTIREAKRLPSSD